MDGVPALASALSGIRRAYENMDGIASNIASGTDPGQLPADFAGLKQSEFQVQANASVVRTANEMVGTLLDTIA